MKVENWFPSSIGLVDLETNKVEKINKKIYQWISNNRLKITDSSLENLKFTLNTSENILDDPDLIFINKIFTHSANQFLEIINVKKSSSIKIAGSWLNVFSTNSLETTHSHHGSLFSGVYFVEGGENSGNFYIEDPVEVRNLWHNNYKQYLIENRNIVLYPPLPGRLMFFPSWLKHGVHKNNSLDNRISLAFNISVDSSNAKYDFKRS